MLPKAFHRRFLWEDKGEKKKGKNIFPTCSAYDGNHTHVFFETLPKLLISFGHYSFFALQLLHPEEEKSWQEIGFKIVQREKKDLLIFFFQPFHFVRLKTLFSLQWFTPLKNEFNLIPISFEKSPLVLPIFLFVSFYLVC